MQLDHEKLDVYQVGLEFAVWAYTLCRALTGADRHARDQMLRASQSICLNIAEACGKLSPLERARFLQIAAGSARECAAILDILHESAVIQAEKYHEGKELLVRIVAMLTRMIENLGRAREGENEYGGVNENVDG